MPLSRTLLKLGAAAAGAALLRRWWSRRNPVDLRGKVVIITGASAGIGKAAALAFAAEGCHLVLVARRAELLESVCAEAAQYHAEALAVRADLTDEADLQRIVESALKQFGRVDILINNAGLSMGGPLQDHDPAALRRMIDLNLYGLLRLTQLVLPHLLAQKGGHIVNISSVAGGMMAPGQIAYGATKAAVNSLGEGLHRELAGTGVHVSTVMPGWTRTDMISHIEADMRQRMMVNPFMPVFTAEAMAQTIVDAVRYRRRRVVRGGLGFETGILIQRLIPEAMDIWFRTGVYGSSRMSESLRDMGGKR